MQTYRIKVHETRETIDVTESELRELLDDYSKKNSRFIEGLLGNYPANHFHVFEKETGRKVKLVAKVQLTWEIE